MPRFEPTPAPPYDPSTDRLRDHILEATFRVEGWDTVNPEVRMLMKEYGEATVAKALPNIASERDIEGLRRHCERIRLEKQETTDRSARPAKRS